MFTCTHSALHLATLLDCTDATVLTELYFFCVNYFCLHIIVFVGLSFQKCDDNGNKHYSHYDYM